MTGRVFVVASGKGGVGKTTAVVNLGVALRRADHSVALVDADLGMANLATLLGIDPDPTLHDVLAGEVDFETAIHDREPGFAVLPGSRDLETYASANPDGLRAVIDELRDDYEYVLVDAGAGLSYEDVLPLGLGDEVILVTTPQEIAIGDAKKTAEFARLVDRDVAGVVVNRVHDDVDAEAIADELGTQPLAVIPEDPAIRAGSADGTPVHEYAPNSDGATAFRQLARVLAADPGESPDVPAGGEDVADDGTDSGGSGESPRSFVGRIVARFR